jgi:hypothetical protein
MNVTDETTKPLSVEQFDAAVAEYAEVYDAIYKLGKTQPTYVEFLLFMILHKLVKIEDRVAKLEAKARYHNC